MEVNFMEIIIPTIPDFILKFGYISLLSILIPLMSKALTVTLKNSEELNETCILWITTLFMKVSCAIYAANDRQNLIRLCQSPINPVHCFDIIQQYQATVYNYIADMVAIGFTASFKILHVPSFTL
uniref:Transmembrane protein n=1 Tax=Heterorhabditis bacteriophora TaxID=37862 RepID=A0A1I7WT73_HETBA